VNGMALVNYKALTCEELFCCGSNGDLSIAGTGITEEKKGQMNFETSRIMILQTPISTVLKFAKHCKKMCIKKE